MSCLSPMLIRNKRYSRLSFHALQAYCREELKYDNCIYSDFNKDWPRCFYPCDWMIYVPCGSCAECRKKKRLSWAHRISVEMMSHKESTFLTLTLDDKSLSVFKDDPKRPLKLFIDRLRKSIGFRPRYFFVSELGDKNGRLHYHGIIFGTEKNKIPYSVQRGKWQYGHVWLAEFCNVKTANYITKYMLKDSDNYKPFIMCSNGIGLSYVTEGNRRRFINGFDFNGYTRLGSAWYPLHRYYIDKFMNDDLRLCKMLNQMYAIPQTEWYFKKVTYTDQYSYLLVRAEFYERTLKLQFSRKKTIKNGSICISQTRTSENRFIESLVSDSEIYDFRSWSFDSDFGQRCNSWRSLAHELSLFD